MSKQRPLRFGKKWSPIGGVQGKIVQEIANTLRFGDPNIWYEYQFIEGFNGPLSFFWSHKFIVEIKNEQDHLIGNVTISVEEDFFHNPTLFWIGIVSVSQMGVEDPRFEIFIGDKNQFDSSFSNELLAKLQLCIGMIKDTHDVRLHNHSRAHS